MVKVGKQMIGLLLVLLTMKALAQPKCKVEYYSTENGLSHQAVTTIIQDREGFMWLGTWDGINRFDGKNFQSYKSSPGDQSQLGNDRVDQIVEDQANCLWILAYDRLIYRFDKATQQFMPFSAMINKKITFSKILHAGNGWVWMQSTNDGLYGITQKGRQDVATARLPLSAKINFFYPDANNQVWIGTDSTLSFFVIGKDGSVSNKPAVYTGACTAVKEDADQLYFATSKGELIIYNKKHPGYATYKLTNEHIHALQRSHKGGLVYATTSKGKLISFDLVTKQVTTHILSEGQSLHSMYEDRKGRLWIEPKSGGVVLFDPGTRGFRHFTQSAANRLNLINNHIRVIEDNNGVIWVFMKGGGFGYYKEAEQTFDYAITTPDAGISRLPTNIYSLYYDKAGIIWLTNNERQLVKIILQTNGFHQQVLVQEAAFRHDNEVRGICNDHRNRLWIGAKSGKVYVFENGKPLANVFDNGSPEGMVYAIMEDSRRNIWLGTKNNGLYKAIPTGSRYHLIHYAALPFKEVYSLLEDRQGRVWVGSFDSGLFEIKDGRFVKPANYPKEGCNKIRYLALDAGSNMWIGTTNGLLLMNTKEQFALYRKIPGDVNSLGNNDIQFILRDRRNQLWLCTSGGGLSQAIGEQPFQSLRFRNYTTKDGMPNDYVLSSAEDKEGNLWLATENGLSRFNPVSKTFRNYDSYDGLPRAAFSEAAATRLLPNGQLVFGSSNGFIQFDPAGINSSRTAANIAFTNLQINNEDAGGINYTGKLMLKHHQNIISIAYAVLDNRSGNRHSLQYRLVGFDSTWHADQLQRRTTYTNLPPGNYLFEVKSVTDDLYSNTPYKSVAITILPPPWKTWWAYLLYALAIAVLLFFIRRNALAMMRLRNKIALEQKLSELKTNFFTNVSHELRTPLTLIVNPLEQLAAKEKLSAEGAGYVEVARKNASRMVRFINQLLDLRKIESNKATMHRSMVDLAPFVQKIGEHFSAELGGKNLTLTIVSESVIAWIDAEKLDVVVYNLLANAVKFTPPGKTITLVTRNVTASNQVVIEVRDQGPGVEAGKLQEIFELFYEGDHPTGRAQKGSGIGLALSRELVQLHGGQISALNNTDGGLTVTVTLPVGNEGTPPAHTPNAEQFQVLLVEDNDELRSFLQTQLSEFYRVETAANGAEGWEKANQWHPDLILSDIMMPVMDGIQLLDKIKSDINTSHIPVVLLSARHSVESQIEGLQYGADHYITKPFNRDLLLAAIDNLLKQRKKLFDGLVRKTVDLSPAPVVVTSKDETFLKDVIQVVEASMTDPGFNIETVAERMHMSRTTFYKKFKSLTGLTPVEFVRDMRLQRAKQYLDAGNDNISEVAYWSGFNNPKYFSTCFREKYQVTPSDYVKTKS